MLLWKVEITRLFDVERKKNTQDAENVVLKVLPKMFLLTSESVHGRPSIKWTLWKGNDMLYYYDTLVDKRSR